MFEKVLLPTDFSPDSQRVLGYVKEIPGVREVILLHVVDATRQSVKGPSYSRSGIEKENISRFSGIGPEGR